jgi:hypothetical protein
VYAAMLVRQVQQTSDATASVARSIMAQVEAFALRLCGYTRRPRRHIPSPKQYTEARGLPTIGKCTIRYW